MSPRLIACTAALLLVAGAARAQPGGPPDATCRSALAALDEAEAASRPALATLQAARQRAARACLGGTAASAPQAPRLQPPVSVAPVVVPDAPVRPRTPNPAPLALPPPPAAPLLVTTCDPYGCWASDSTYWHRAGAELIGPRGRCRVEGVRLVCP
jgi:hypothetical protein